eukprot:CAMPEP_0194270586 /NCGR_PEP_ID=MMETSP0169-20130528/4547_1 /TAXON_ID=218684 /ORGANISM="Corethron pennatum, Strain L29A3" /LENGTH=1608 /DNA_ID=CAMNT_0039012683 /DNA_START=49 /DNA_END=4875 /DNA_ORIENTATION=-
MYFISACAVLALGFDAFGYVNATDEHIIKLRDKFFQPVKGVVELEERAVQAEEWTTKSKEKANTNLAQSTVLKDVTFPAISSKIAEFCEFSIDKNSKLPSDFTIKRAGLNSAVNEGKVPARIVYPKSIAEVQEAVNTTARLREKYGGQICVRGSGSGFAGLSWGCDNGTVLDMSNFRVFDKYEEDLDIQFSADDTQVTVGASIKQGDLHVALAARNRALPLGAWGSLSVVGFTIGGGFSEIARHYGLACDWVASADIVLSNGSLVTINSGDDLLWHLRGGGGGVGVIVSLTFNLIPHLPRLVSCFGTWSSGAATEILRWWGNHELNNTMSYLVKSFSMRLVLSSSIMNLIQMHSLYVIPDGESESQALAQVSKFLHPIAGSALFEGIKYKVLTWAEYNSKTLSTDLDGLPSDSPNVVPMYGPSVYIEEPKTGDLCKFWGSHRSHFMSRFTDRNIAVAVNRVGTLLLQTDESFTRRVVINAWGGEIINNSMLNNTSFWGRDASFEVNLEVEYDPRMTFNHLPVEPPWRDLKIAFNWARWAEGWIERTSAELCYYGNPMCHFGFVNHESKAVHAPRLYGPHLTRLRLIKDTFDPSSLFVAKTDYNNDFTLSSVKEHVATLDILMGIDESSEIRMVRHRPPVIGYAELYRDLPRPSVLERIDVLAIFAATTLVRNTGNMTKASKFSCNTACDIGFADASYELFQSHSKTAKRFVQGAVLLTFGGHAMNPCYKLCMSVERVHHLASQLAGLVSDMHLDGVDFNIEIPPEPTSIKFVEDLVMATYLALKAKNNIKKWVLSHAPIAHQLDHGGIWLNEYYNINDYLGLFSKLHKAGLLSFIFIQYYNTFPAVITKDNPLGTEALIGHATRLRRSLPAEKLVLGVCSVPGCGAYMIKGGDTRAMWQKMQDLYQNPFGGLGLWALSRETTANFLDDFVANTYSTSTSSQTSNINSLLLVIVLAVSTLIITASIFAPDKTVIEGVWSVKEQKDVISSPLPGLITVFIPAYKESESEMRTTMANLKQCNISNVHIRSALRVYFIVDNTRDSVPVQTLLSVCDIDCQQSEVERGTPVLSGTCYGIKVKIVLKGETSAWPGGKRHSAVLFTKLVNDDYHRDVTAKPWAALCLDSDVITYPHSIERLIVDLLLNPHCAITCGNMVPSKSNMSLAVHLQKAEYHLQNRVVKNAEALFGCVSCCPGAFMCIKFSVFDNVLNIFVGQNLAPDACFLRNVIDLGEDRYLTSVMLTSLGEQTTFCMSALCSTEVPGDFHALITQRRRWFNSSFCNDIFLICEAFYQTWTMIYCSKSIKNSSRPHVGNIEWKHNDPAPNLQTQKSRRRGSYIATVTHNSTIDDILRRKDQKTYFRWRLPYVFVSALLRAIGSVLSPGFAILLMFQISLFAQMQSLIDQLLLSLIIKGAILLWVFFIFMTFAIIGKNKKSWFAQNEKKWVEIQTGLAVTFMVIGFAAVLAHSDTINLQIVLVGILCPVVVLVVSIAQISDYRAGSGLPLFFSFVIYVIVGIPFFTFIQPVYAFAQIDNFTWGTRETEEEKNSEKNSKIDRSILCQKLLCWFSVLIINVAFFLLYIFLPTQQLIFVMAGLTAASFAYFLLCGFVRNMFL